MQEKTREQVCRQEAAISRLYQRSRECFRHLKAAAAHPAQQTCIPLQDGNLHIQPSACLTADCSADVQPMRTTQEVQREQQVQLDVAALESQPSQPRSASPVKGIFMHSSLQSVSSWLEPYDFAHCCSLWFIDRIPKTKAPILTDIQEHFEGLLLSV